MIRYKQLSLRIKFLTLSALLVVFVGFFLLMDALSFTSLDPVDGAVTILPYRWERNGTRSVPMGLLGVHNVPLDDETAEEWGVTGTRRIHHRPGAVTMIPGPGRRNQLEKGIAATTDKKKKRNLQRQLKQLVPSSYEWTIDCLFDRYQPALQVSNPEGWEAILREQVRTFVAHARKSGQQHRIEFWNEPYLNWATKPGVNYSPQYYRTENIQEGDPMVLKANGQTVPGLVWGPKRFYVKKPGGIDYVLSGYIDAKAKPGKQTRLRYGAGNAVLNIGGKVKIRGKEHNLGYGHWGRDSGQKHYWAGPVSAEWYNEMFRVVGEELEALNAQDIPLAGGWGFSIFNEGWDSWRYLIKPLIDAGHPWLDAIHEHHYGGDVRRVGCSYEVAYAYALATYGKRLEFWNTEAGGHLDPQQPGNVKPHNTGDPLTKARASMTYLLRDVIYQWTHVPDKAIFRAAHHSHQNGGDEWAFRLLKEMTGDFLVVENPVKNVWAVASKDKTSTTILLFNDRREEIHLGLNLPLRRGKAHLASIVTENGQLALQETSSRIRNGVLVVDLPKLSALRITLPAFSTTETVTWEQFSSPDVLQSLEPGLDTSFTFEEKEIYQSSAAKLRLVIDRPQASLTLRAGEKVQLLKNVPFGISDHSLTVELFKEFKDSNTIRFEDGEGTLMATSLWIQK